MPEEEKSPARKRIEQSCSKNPEFKSIWHNVINRFLISKNFYQNIDGETSSITDTSTMTDDQIKKLIDLFYNGKARLLYKTDYPFYADGLIVKSITFEKELDVYSRRLGRFKIKDSPERNEYGFLYWMQTDDNVRRGLTFYPTAKNQSQLTIKFDKNDKFSVLGFALLGFSRGSNESKWVGWNDRIGWMKGVTGAARLCKNKHSEIGFSVEIVKFTARYNKNFEMTTIILLTDQITQETEFPKEAVYVKDLVLNERHGSKLYFNSESLGISCMIDENQTMSDVRPNVYYEGVIVPHFVTPLELEWRGLMLATPEIAKDKKFERLRMLAMKNKIHLFGKDNNDNFESSTETRSSIDNITVIKEDV